MKQQHTEPCKECPFRRIAPKGWLGGNTPKSFTFCANHDGHFPCHMTMGNGASNERECAGRAIMYANQCKQSRDSSVPRLEPDRERVFGNIREFADHHGVEITSEELIFGPERPQ